MKRILSITLLILTLLLSGCKGENIFAPQNTESDANYGEFKIVEPVDGSVNGYRIKKDENQSSSFTDAGSSKTEAHSNLYYANTKSKKFHLSSCGSIKQTKNENLLIADNREELIAENYEPCKRCNP